MLAATFIGHLHPLIVHLPIGILLFAFVLMLFQRFRQLEMEAAISLALLLGAISAAAACGAGWLLAQSGEYEADMIFKHQWTGIATSILAFGAYFFKRFRPVLATITAVVLSIAGHLGGNITHGEGYLFPDEETEKISQIIDKQKINKNTDSVKTHLARNEQPLVRRSFVYQDKIVPILKTKCYNCHSAAKKKNGLRLDTEQFIRAGGKNGRIFTAGNPENSVLFTHLILPLDDEKHMPPRGKSQLSAQEIATIHFWIKKGASFKEEIEIIKPNTDQIAQSLAVPALPKNLISETPKLAEETPEITPEESLEAQILAKKMDKIAHEILEKLKQQQVSITTLGEGQNYYSVNFVNVKNYAPALIDDLKSIENQLIRLRLSNQPVSNDDLKRVASFKNLTRLNLEKTAISDEALAYLKDLPNLEQLNLYGTNITDKGLAELAKCSRLKVLYLWQTNITEAGVTQLKKALPKLSVETGNFQFTKR